MKKATDFLFDTSQENRLRLSEKVQESNKTILIFSRYIGCPFCQVDISELCGHYEHFLHKNAQVLMVLQSSAETIRNQTFVDTIPFPVICDPKGELYQLYHVKAAKNSLKLIDLKDRKFWHKVKKLMQLKLKHGAYKGNEQQLPALFILNHNMDLLYSHYAKSISDMPDVDGILKLL